MDSNGLTASRYNVIMNMLHSIAKKEGITNPKIEIIKGCEKGDGFAGEKSIAIVKGGNKKCVEFFIKGAPTNLAYKKAFDPRPIYLLEILFYKDIYPLFNEFQIKRKIPKPFTSVVQCLETSSEKDNEVLILQNAKNLGFELWDRKKQMNPEHVEFVYKEYGKFHGLSYAMKDQEPNAFQSLLDKFPINAFQLMAVHMLDGCIKMAEDVKSQFDQIKEVEVYNAYCQFVESMPQFFDKLQHDEQNEFRVITHGDCWCTNMMFKYAPNSNKIVPDKVCLLDFQILGHTSPAMDLGYFMYASSPPEIYTDFEHYLKIYHKSLSKTVSDLGSGENVIPSIAELKYQWKMYAKYGLIMSFIVLKACLQEADETQDISEALEENGGTDLMGAFSKSIKNDDIYYQRIKSIIVHLAENDFL